MYLALTEPLFWAFSLFFILASFVSWFIPGWVVLSKVSWKQVGLKATLALPMGLALWGVQGYVFGYLGLRLLTFLYLFIFTVVFFQQQRQENWKSFRSLVMAIRNTPGWLALSLVAATVLQVFVHVGSGLRTAQGVMFYFVNSVDGMMHLSYIQELARRFPPQEPGAIGLALQNYHYWSDLVLADLHRVWQIPVIHLFFQFAPVLLGLWSMLLVVQLIRWLGGNGKTIFVALFLFSIGADATYLITQALHGNWGATVASFDSGPTFFFNMPQVFARFIFLTALLLVLRWWKEKSWKVGVLAVMLIATLFGFKVYYALYAVFGLCVLCGAEVITTFSHYVRKNSVPSSLRFTFTQYWQIFFLIFLLAGISLSIYVPPNSGAGGLVYSFLEWPRKLLSSDNIDFADWYLRMQVYEAAGNTRNIVILNLLAVFLTFVAVYGTRMLGLIPLFRARGEDWRHFLIFILPANLLFILLGLFTLQTSGGLNIFNFLIVPIVTFNILVAFSLAQLPNKIFVPVFFLFALLTVPRSVLQLQDYGARYAQAKTDLTITEEQLAAFAFLRENTAPDAVIQGLVSAQEDQQNQLSLYIPFFSQRDSYAAGLNMLESHNQPMQERIDVFEDALKKFELYADDSALQELGISYLWVLAPESKRFPQDPVFENNEVSIYSFE